MTLSTTFTSFIFTEHDSQQLHTIDSLQGHSSGQIKYWAIKSSLNTFRKSEGLHNKLSEFTVVFHYKLITIMCPQMFGNSTSHFFLCIKEENTKKLCKYLKLNDNKNKISKLVGGCQINDQRKIYRFKSYWKEKGIKSMH